MHRWLAAVVIAACLVPVHHAHALGLGDLEVKSALNEPLRAELVLVGATRDELTTLEIGLASQETFERNGLVKETFMSGFRFRVRPTGTPVVEITSTQPVTEPFVTMLIEATWPRGRLLREYTVLLDPPTYAAPTTAAAPPVSRPAPAQRPAGTSGTVRRSPPAPTRSNVASTAGGDYRVQRGDSLWNIATSLAPGDTAAINQAMMAIYQANPDAFDGNINRLRAGAVLNLPSESDLFQINRQAALEEVRRQNADWQGGSGSLRLVPPDDNAGLGISTGSESAGTGTGGTASTAEMAAIQRELSEKERLLAIRNEEIARLQAQLA
ncbi:MAG: FimV/HubP family polar landmark protein, partial [Pseudomonadota bacterium]